MRIAGKLSTLLVAVLGAACAIDSGKLADEALTRVVGPDESGHASLVAFTRRADSVQVDSVALARGEIARAGAPRVLSTTSASWGTLEIAAPAADREAMIRALDIGADDGDRWLDGATSSIAGLLNLFQPLDLAALRLKIVVVPTNVAYVHEETSLASDDPFVFTALVRVDPEAGKPAAEWYSQMARVAAHELLHVTFFLNDLKPVSQFNEETAASILGFCGTVLFARAVKGRVTVGLKLRDSHSYLSAAEPPAFDPDRRYVERGAPTTEGANMAVAVLITLMGDAFASDDDKVDSLLLPACAALARGAVPDFVGGESLSVPAAP